MREKLTFWKYLKANHPWSSGVILACMFFIAFGIADKSVFIAGWGLSILIVFTVAGIFDVRKKNRRGNGTTNT